MQNQKLTPEELLEARDWIKDCCPSWRDLNKEDVDGLTDEEVTRGVQRNFSGGISQFKSNLPDK
ncbi:MAG: peptide ABC transporter substrate-binding protein [Nostoc sp.]|uniref:peptide ABC transporter substrate-binding protein n=1 Tax=Nostoc sp. TaxID=1180 RepID=UPI002FFCC57D